MDGLERLAQVGGHEELNLVHTGVIHAILPRIWVESGDKLHLRHIQLAQLLLYPLLELSAAFFRAFVKAAPRLTASFRAFSSSFSRRWMVSSAS